MDAEYNQCFIENIVRCGLYSALILRIRENYDTLSYI